MQQFPSVEMKDESNNANWQSRCEAFASDSSFAGVLYVFKSKSWIKRIFWALVILTAIAGFVTVTTLNIRMLLREPIATSITMTRENELSFPAVTICNLNLFDTTTLRKANVLYDLSQLFTEIVDNSDLSQCMVAANNVASQPGYNISWAELTTIAGNNFSKLLQMCSFGGKKCTIHDFTPINTVGGQCYTINGHPSEKKLVAQGTGIRKGLRLQLLWNPFFLLSGFSIFRDYGYRIIIHNPDEPPRPESEGIVVSLDSNAHIGMRKIISIDRTEYSSATKCKNDYDITNMSEPTPTQYSSYSASLCQLQCLYEHVIRNCGCQEGKLYTLTAQVRNCTTVDLCCEIQEFFAVNETCDCLPRCTTTEYPLTISSSTNQFFGQLVGINIYYESLTVETRVTTDSYTPWSFISDIGGNTGLFIGITLLSWVELILLVVGLMKDCCCKILNLPYLLLKTLSS